MKELITLFRDILEMLKKRQARCREITGPTPHLVALVSGQNVTLFLSKVLAVVSKLSCHLSPLCQNESISNDSVQ